jgi:hypothetical protein
VNCAPGRDRQDAAERLLGLASSMRGSSALCATDTVQQWGLVKLRYIDPISTLFCARATASPALPCTLLLHLLALLPLLVQSALRMDAEHLLVDTVALARRDVSHHVRLHLQSSRLLRIHRQSQPSMLHSMSPILHTDRARRAAADDGV